MLNYIMIKKILSLESAAILAASTYGYHLFSGNWLMFFIVLIGIDISIAGYLISKRVGSIAYNLLHNYLLAVILISLGLLTQNDLFISLGLIVSAHVGMDRALNLGLKYPDNFKHTHLQEI